MAKYIFKAVLCACIAPLVACTAEPPSQQQVWEDETGRVELVELSAADQRALIAAPAKVLVGALPSELKNAIESNSIESLKVQLVQDKIDGEVIDEFPPTYQGWIYYEPTKRSDNSHFAPAVLCVSQSSPINWKHCQDESDLATKRLIKRLRQQS